ncbi:N-acetyltransferase family 8 member 3-like [Tiliqua scincoides]|uniref:N-acetyltransferase family 8 member 3-like n=1 Tax=Tiliqua scincoides TaxID=71010 RepID=UPI0034632F2D
MSIMGEYHIRTYEDRDYDAVRTLFSCGITEHVPAALQYVLKSPLTHLLLLGVFLLAYLISSSSLFSLGVVAALCFMGSTRIKALWLQYVREALDSDMRDIRRTYLEPKDCCFWVVETGQEVVGMVVAVHPEDPSLRGRALELKRMSVAKQHRGRGLSKALTKTVIHFAQERGYQEVVLGTTMVQYAAQRVYEGMGFRKVKEIYPSLVARLVQFSVYLYRYKIAES